MPIYAYRCATCGHAQDALQKMSDPLLTVCPACGAATYEKQLTAAGFQLKGSGWYVTDFRNGNTAAAAKKDGEAAAGEKGDKGEKGEKGEKAEKLDKASDKPGDKPAADKAAGDKPAAAPAAASPAAPAAATPPAGGGS